MHEGTSVSGPLLPFWPCPSAGQVDLLQSDRKHLVGPPMKSFSLSGSALGRRALRAFNISSHCLPRLDVQSEISNTSGALWIFDPE